MAASPPSADGPRSAQPGKGPAERISRMDPEVELWQGRYSAKAMVGAWAACAVLTVAGIVLVALVATAAAGLAVLGVVAALWAYSLLVLAYRRLRVRYRLTNQRFFHEVGLLSRTTNRIEVIDMDDITFRQGLVDRMLGVGSVLISSSDRTHPEMWLHGIDDVVKVAGLIDDARRKERLRRGMFIESV